MSIVLRMTPDPAQTIGALRSSGFKQETVKQEMRRNLYLASKEAVHNIIKHAGATEAVIAIFIINNELRITIQDNGHGFENPAHMPFGNGLKNMDRRMKQIGGYLLVVNDEGTVVNLAAPLAL